MLRPRRTRGSKNRLKIKKATIYNCTNREEARDGTLYLSFSLVGNFGKIHFYAENKKKIKLIVPLSSDKRMKFLGFYNSFSCLVLTNPASEYPFLRFIQYAECEGKKKKKKSKDPKVCHTYAFYALCISGETRRVQLEERRDIILVSPGQQIIRSTSRIFQLLTHLKGASLRTSSKREKGEAG